MKLTFLGAAREVTGSNYLIETKNESFIVDCGMFQGGRELEKLNYEPFSFNPKELDFMILTHAHIDHSGRIPKLIKDGFKGKIFATKPTVDLCEIMLMDSAKIQESDAEWENKRRRRSGKPDIEPLYTRADAELSMKHFVPNHYGFNTIINENITVRFRDAGHILGSSFLEIWVKEDEKITKLAFSGDLGMPGRPIIRDPEYLDSCDYLVMESTYGSTVHESYDSSIVKLIGIIDEVTSRGGSVIIPSFAVGRTQELIYELNNFYEYNQRLEEYRRIPIYIDSPMAVAATEAFMKNSYVFDEEARELILKGDNIFEFPNLKYVRTMEESKMLNAVKFPRVIISSSGMATAGRIRHHLKHHLWDPKSAVVFVGYQAEGSLGRLIEDGAPKVNLLGEEIAVKCDVYKIEGFSGHADEPMLLEWVNNIEKKPKKLFLTHGEIDQSEPLAKVLTDKLGISVVIPELNRSEDLINGTEPADAEIIERDSGELDRELVDLFLNVDSLEKAKSSAELSELSPEKYDSLKGILMDLNRGLMDLNMILGK